MMDTLLAFTPFIVYAIVEARFGSITGLLSAAAVAAILVARTWMTPGRVPKVLEIGTLLLFAGLAGLYVALGRPAWPTLGIKLSVDAGLFAIVLVSLAIHQPFTLQYAREKVARELWDRPEFIRTNYVITVIWALAFVLVLVSDFILFYQRNLGLIVMVLAYVGAIAFTSWYPAHQRSAAAK